MVLPMIVSILVGRVVRVGEHRVDSLQRKAHHVAAIEHSQGARTFPGIANSAKSWTVITIGAFLKSTRRLFGIHTRSMRRRGNFEQHRREVPENSTYAVLPSRADLDDCNVLGGCDFVGYAVPEAEHHELMLALDYVTQRFEEIAARRRRHCSERLRRRRLQCGLVSGRRATSRSGLARSMRQKGIRRAPLAM